MNPILRSVVVWCLSNGRLITSLRKLRKNMSYVFLRYAGRFSAELFRREPGSLTCLFLWEDFMVIAGNHSSVFKCSVTQVETAFTYSYVHLQTEYTSLLCLHFYFVGANWWLLCREKLVVCVNTLAMVERCHVY